MVQPNLAPTLCCIYIAFPASVICVHKHAAACNYALLLLYANTSVSCLQLQPLHCVIPAFTQYSI